MGGAFCPVCKLKEVQIRAEEGFDVFHDQPPDALHDDEGRSDRAVVTEA